jgi:polyphosphate kinase 2
MDTAYFSAIAALSGSVVGGLTSLAASWVTQNAQAVRALHCRLMAIASPSAASTERGLGSESDAVNEEQESRMSKRTSSAGKAESPRPSGGQEASGSTMKRKEYEAALAKFHVELVKVQEWVKSSGAKICILFEGRDGAGKGGTIKAITERVSPRTFRVVALPAPTEREKSQMYIQRYLPHLPAAGEIVIFDRSWYNRAGVERVMGFCTEHDVQRFLAIAPYVEKAIVESGVLLIKYWLEVSQEEQTRRLEDRIHDGRKIWKLSPMDLKSYSMWYDYSRARDEMFQATDTSWAPWYVAHSDNKRRARLNIIAHMLNLIPYEDIPRQKVKLPSRQKRRSYREPSYQFKLVPEKY